jgi:hypothetical protein
VEVEVELQVGLATLPMYSCQHLAHCVLVQVVAARAVVEVLLYNSDAKGTYLVEEPCWVVVLGLVVQMIHGVEVAAMVAVLGVEELLVDAAAAGLVVLVVAVAAVQLLMVVVIQVVVAGSVFVAMATGVELLPVKL